MQESSNQKYKGVNIMNEVNHALQRIARGDGIISIGTVISMLFKCRSNSDSVFEGRIRSI